jgi:CelD/BcsL family acetyltransferase involved in cellulose biosynthesis
LTASLQVLGTADRQLWMGVLSTVAQHDVYHLPEYHEAAEQAGEGEARLLAYREAGYSFALPVLVRPCGKVDGLDGLPFSDATSVYGYAGPVSSHEDPPAAVVARFHAALQEALAELRVVALFARLHPLIPQDRLVAGLGVTAPTGTTVSIDLIQPPDAQVAAYRQNHRDGIRKLRRLGAECLPDTDPAAMDEFVRIYHETMRRVDADPYYLFDRGYFARLTALLGPAVHLFTCRLDNEIIGGGLFSACRGLVQYHLGGTRTEYLKLAPMKLLFDSVREWAVERGMRVFHLGGGVGGREDSLFHFKAGFSSGRHAFATWRWTVDPERYRELADRKATWNARHGVTCASPEFFPAYRCPTEPIDPPPAPA